MRNSGSRGGHTGATLPGVAALAVVAIAALPAGAIVPDPGHYPLYLGSSADGTRAFLQTTEPLVAGDNDNRLDIYERSGRRTIRISAGPRGGNGTFGAFYAGTSAAGSRVFFETAERLVAADGDAGVDVYERRASTTTLVSRGPAGSGRTAGFVGASSDGTRVFFHTADRLVPSDTDDLLDVYERAGGVTRLISTGSNGGNDEFVSEFQGASSDGTRVFFHTDEPLEADDGDASLDVYERSADQTTLLTGGVPDPDAQLRPSFSRASADGTRVFFVTDEQLVGADTDAAIDAYEASEEITLVSAGEINGNGEHMVNLRGISPDGARAYFDTVEQLVDRDGDSERDIYERSGGTTQLVSAGEINGDGRFAAAFAGFAQGDPRDDPRVYFHTEEQLVPGDTDQSLDLYERAGGTTALVSAGEINGDRRFTANFEHASADGSSVLFETSEPLVPADEDSAGDLYRRSGGVTSLVSAGLPGPHEFASLFGGASADAARVFFTTDEPISDADPDTVRDVYQRAGAATTLLSRETIRPQTWIRRGPEGTTTAKRPWFRLRASEPGSTFRCRIDSRRQRCGSRLLLGRLSLGSHVLRARAIDPAGNRDATAARRTFRVVK